MAIFGINFGRPPIPPIMRKRFAEWKKFDLPRGQHARLVGVCQSKEERDIMLISIDNGKRRIWVEERKTAGAPWYGIYTD